MPGFTIHLAIAKQYITKNQTKIKLPEEFIKGSIAPDLNEDMTQIATNKSQTHYGKWGNWRCETNIDEFLKDERVDINQDFWKGYCLHLLTDYYYYNKIFTREIQEAIKNKDNFYNDYDCLNKTLIEKYKLSILDNIKKYMYEIDGEPKYLKIDKIIRFYRRYGKYQFRTTNRNYKTKRDGGN